MKKSLLLGGILPVIAYAVVEAYGGIVWGIVAGMVFGVGEIIHEWIRDKKVDPITWGGNALILVLGGVALFTQEGVWFKLQPAIMELVFGLLLMGSFFARKPFMVMLANKQKLFDRFPPPVRPIIEDQFSSLTLRLGIFLLLHAALATWAALAWSTTAWAILKGVGFTLSLVVYMVVEVIVMRARLKRSQAVPFPVEKAD